jgi:hypothetical protein
MPKLPSSQKNRWYIGIDPGKSGGLACLNGGSPFSVEAMPPTDADVLNWFNSQNGVNQQCWVVFAVLEKVGGYLRGNAHPGSAMFNFGANYGALRMALTAAGIPFEEVMPGVWQRGLGIPPRKKTENKGKWKNRLRAKAQQLFPGVKVTLATCDALLIAEFCRRKHEGLLR